MKRAAPLFFVCTALFAAEQVQSSQSHRYSWLRRVTLAGACAATFFDAYSTRVAVSHGALEGNGLLSENGHPRWGRIIGLKVGSCAGAVLLQEAGFFKKRLGASPDGFWIAANTALMGGFTWAGVHNLGVANRVNEQPRPAYLVRPSE